MPAPSSSSRRCIWLLTLIGFALCFVYLFLVTLAANVPDKLHRLPLHAKPIRNSKTFSDLENPQPTVDSKWIKNRITNDTSPLGNWLLSQEGSPPPDKINFPRSIDNVFLILVWKNGPFLERRHLRRFSRDKKYSPWANCSVNNCELTYNSEDFDEADAVIFHLHRTPSVESLPRRESSNQRWIFLSDETPYNTFLIRNQSISDYNGLFNWSMTYRMNSDVPVPYGRTILAASSSSSSLSNEIPDDESMHTLVKKWDKLVAILGSNCSGRNKRWVYVKMLKNILGDRLEILGHCLNGNQTACPGHFGVDCPALNGYKFYLAFENSNCREYLTEKVFWNAYHKFAVPVIMGAPRTDCERLLPPKSYLHVDDFANPSSLANYLLYLDRHEREYEKLHAWRSSYRVINEHGYFGSASKHYCRVCEALNYNSPDEKVYDDLEQYWSKERDCREFPYQFS